MNEDRHRLQISDAPEDQQMLRYRFEAWIAVENTLGNPVQADEASWQAFVAGATLQGATSPEPAMRRRSSGRSRGLIAPLAFLVTFLSSAPWMISGMYDHPRFAFWDGPGMIWFAIYAAGLAALTSLAMFCEPAEPPADGS